MEFSRFNARPTGTHAGGVLSCSDADETQKRCDSPAPIFQPGINANWHSNALFAEALYAVAYPTDSP